MSAMPRGGKLLTREESVRLQLATPDEREQIIADYVAKLRKDTYRQRVLVGSNHPLATGYRPAQ